MNYSYVIIDDDQESILKTKAIADGFSELSFIGSVQNAADGLNLILEKKPEIIFLEIDPVHVGSNLSLSFIDTLHKYLTILPKIIVTTQEKNLAFDSFKYEVKDYLLKPVTQSDIIKLLLRLNKSKREEEIGIVERAKHTDNFPFSWEQKMPNELHPLRLCIKSYGDHRYIDAKDICFLQADNNSTDIHLNNGEMITAFKTLKYFEAVLSYPFIRIHKSYIVNRNYISRIHNGNSVCYIKNTNSRLPFSKLYKGNVDRVISDFANGNYLEI
ncbi:LytTR family two component transcriptional regulator [Flavobacterium limicola]|uniref:LytTR family two component transcriptional regulator n=1 Tax=Flavobacterium limicola TaxID=180441 RepID=A0A495S5U7_9FLAO|nr:LytTR family DNA-binding domain-containing protein [Flavobacterium limicola]RKS94999.1 LytTR family two component transcriptional regulator [Flavobacterium limicola]